MELQPTLPLLFYVKNWAPGFLRSHARLEGQLGVWGMSGYFLSCTRCSGLLKEWLDLNKIGKRELSSSCSLDNNSYGLEPAPQLKSKSFAIDGNSTKIRTQIVLWFGASKSLLAHKCIHLNVWLTWFAHADPEQGLKNSFRKQHYIQLSQQNKSGLVPLKSCCCNFAFGCFIQQWCFHTLMKGLLCKQKASDTNAVEMIWRK